MQRKSFRLVQQRVWQSQPPSEDPLRKRVPAVIDGRVASPSDSGGEPSHTMQLFRHTCDAELIKQSTRMYFPDSSMTFTDCVLLWNIGCCRHGFAPPVRTRVRILLLGRKINLRGTRKGVIQCLKKWSHTIFGCLLGTMATTPKVLARSRTLMKLNWLPSQSARTNKWLLCHQTLCLCEVSPANGVQDVADSRTHRIAAEMLRELQLHCHQ